MSMIACIDFTIYDFYLLESRKCSGFPQKKNSERELKHEITECWHSKKFLWQCRRLFCWQHLVVKITDDRGELKNWLIVWFVGQSSTHGYITRLCRGLKVFFSCSFFFFLFLCFYYKYNPPCELRRTILRLVTRWCYKYLPEKRTKSLFFCEEITVEKWAFISPYIFFEFSHIYPTSLIYQFLFFFFFLSQDNLKPIWTTIIIMSSGWNTYSTNPNPAPSCELSSSGVPPHRWWQM